jgi:hypothetical protein
MKKPLISSEQGLFILPNLNYLKILKINPIKNNTVPPPASDTALFLKITFGGYIPGFFNARRLWIAPAKNAKLTKKTTLIKIPILPPLS